MRGRKEYKNWFKLILGSWVLISPWVLGFSGITFAKWSNVVAGIVLVLLPLWEMFSDEKYPHNEERS